MPIIQRHVLIRIGSLDEQYLLGHGLRNN